VELCNQPSANEELFPPTDSELEIEIGNGNIFTLATFPHPQQWTIPLFRIYTTPQFHDDSIGL